MQARDSVQVFGNVAALYKDVRPTYPHEVYRRIVEEHGNHPFDVAVDVGCGAGQSIKGLLGIAKKVVGIEPSKPLRDAAIEAYPGVEIIDGSGEDTKLPRHFCDAITIATAFYWMDRSRVLNEVNRIMRSGGVLATYKYDFPWPTGPARSVIERHLNSYWEQFRAKELKEYDNTYELIQDSEYFSTVRQLKVPYPLDFTIAQYVKFMSSTSYVSRYLQANCQTAEEYKDSLIAELSGWGPRLTACFDLDMVLAVKGAK